MPAQSKFQSWREASFRVGAKQVSELAQSKFLCRREASFCVGAKQVSELAQSKFRSWREASFCAGAKAQRDANFSVYAKPALLVIWHSLS